MLYRWRELSEAVFLAGGGMHEDTVCVGVADGFLLFCRGG